MPQLLPRTDRRRFMTTGLTALAGAVFAPPGLLTRPLSAENGVTSLTTGKSISVSISINLVTGTLINFSYASPTGNQPNTYGNVAYLWPVSADSVPWDTDPVACSPIILNQEAGDQNFIDIAVTNQAYIVGYAVGPKNADTGWSAYSNVVASAYIPAGTTPGNRQGNTTSTIKPLYVGSDSLAYTFEFLPGFQASLSGAWVGLWEGEATSYTVAPKAHSPILIGSNAGTSGMNGISLKQGQSYTLGLFCSGYNKDSQKLNLQRLACTTTFST